MKRPLYLLWAVAAAVLVLDRWTKHWASTSLDFNHPVRVVGDYVRLTYTRNSGVAFGIGQGTGFPYYIFSLLAVVVILWMFLSGRARGLVRQLALSLILGGALGNLIDRVTAGEVVDFIEVGIPTWHWPVFNVADSAVTTGVLLFALVWSRQPASEAVPAPADVEAVSGGPDGAPGTAGAEPPGPGGTEGGDEPAGSQGPGTERG